MFMFSTGTPAGGGIEQFQDSFELHSLKSLQYISSILSSVSQVEG